MAWILTSKRSQPVAGNRSFCTITEEILDYAAHAVLDPADMQMLRTQHLPSTSSSA